MFLSQISGDFWMESCHLQELGPQGQEVGAKPGKVLAYLFCYLLWITQHLEEKNGHFETKTVSGRQIGLYVRLKPFRNKNKKIPLHFELLLKLLFNLPQIKLVRLLLLLFKRHIF